MKHVYSIVTTFLLLLMAGITISCEDDYRDMILFEGVEPLYSAAKCDNQVFNSSLYLVEPEGVVLGIDGGDGNYSLSGGSTSIATVEFTKEINGYQRIKISPKSEGTMLIAVSDDSGHKTSLKIAVKDRYKFFLFVEAIHYGFNQELDGDFQNQVTVDLTQRLKMKLQGSYMLIPANRKDVWVGGGELRVKPSSSSEVLNGTYELVEGANGMVAYRFSYGGEVHLLQSEFAFDRSGTRTSVITPKGFYEDVTSYSSIALPDGCKVYREERWMYIPDESLTNGNVN